VIFFGTDLEERRDTRRSFFALENARKGEDRWEYAAIFFAQQVNFSIPIFRSVEYS